MTDARREILGLLALVGMAAAGTSNLIVGRAVPDLIPPVALGFWRWVAVTALLLPFCWPSLRRHRAALAAEWKKLFLLGAIGMGLSGMLPYVATRTTTPTNISLIYTVTTIQITLLAVSFLGEKIRGRQVLGIGLALLGVLTIIFKGDMAVVARLEFVPGDLWALGSATLWALYSFLLRGFSSALPPIVRIWCCALAGAIVLLPAALVEGALVRTPHFDAVTVGAVLFLALIPGLAMYGLHAYGTRLLGAARNSLASYLTPPMAAAFGWLFLGDAVHGFHWAGGTAILLGVWLGTRPAKSLHEVAQARTMP